MQIDLSQVQRESTREFADVLTRCQEELSIQSEGLKRLGRALDGYGPEDAGIHICF